MVDSDTDSLHSTSSSTRDLEGFFDILREDGSEEAKASAKNNIIQCVSNTDDKNIFFNAVNIGSDGDFARALTRRIISNQGLRSVTFVAANFPTECLKKIILEAPHLKELSAFSNGITRSDIPGITEALKRNFTLTNFDVAQNDIGVDGAIELLGAVANNRGAMFNGLRDITFKAEDPSDRRLQKNIGMALGRALTRPQEINSLQVNVDNEVFGDLNFTSDNILNTPDGDEVIEGFAIAAPSVLRELRRQQEREQRNTQPRTL